MSNLPTTIQQYTYEYDNNYKKNNLVKFSSK